MFENGSCLRRRKRFKMPMGSKEALQMELTAAAYNYTPGPVLPPTMYFHQPCIERLPDSVYPYHQAVFFSPKTIVDSSHSHVYADSSRLPQMAAPKLPITVQSFKPPVEPPKIKLPFTIDAILAANG
uniref:Uncharacterized protein n=1 Tax=Plectus sambesii TaxID=2011161 RepID=A0A914X1S2_9BILA